MKSIQQSTKALSPVVASIILIAVAIAVSILTAGWLSQTTNHYKETSAIIVNNAQFAGDSGQPTNTMMLDMKNTGTQAVTIGMIKINGKPSIFSAAPGETTTYAPTETKSLTVNTLGWQEGYVYDVEIYDNEAQIVGAYRATAQGT